MFKINVLIGFQPLDATMKIMNEKSIIDEKIIGGGVFEGRLLIAMPCFKDDSCFDKALVYVCAHSDQGAMGIIVNQAMPMIEFDDLLDQFSLPQSQIVVRPEILFGGPVETMRGFVLHSPEYEHETSVQIADAVSLNATIDILENIAIGAGPRKSLFALGYAGWGPGQLEQEIQSNAWLTSELNEDILFQKDIETKWESALDNIGVAPHQLTHFSGRA